RRRKGGPGTGIGGGGGGAAGRLDDASGDAQAQTVAAGLLRSRAIHAEEGLEDMRHVGLRNARTVVADTDADVSAIDLRLELDGVTVGQRVLDGIVQQVAHEAANLLRVDVE